MSATKWLSSIELWRLDEFNGYWIPRGWAKHGPIKTQSRIDVPAQSTIDAGRQTIAGVAWAPTRGIERVEVQDRRRPVAGRDARRLDRPRLVAAVVLRWNATAGKHTIAVRATDGTGDTQTAEESRARPERRDRPRHDRGDSPLGSLSTRSSESIHHEQCGMSLSRSRSQQPVHVVRHVLQVDLHPAAARVDHAVLGPVGDADLASATTG